MTWVFLQGWYFSRIISGEAVALSATAVSHPVWARVPQMHSDTLALHAHSEWVRVESSSGSRLAPGKAFLGVPHQLSLKLLRAEAPTI